MESSGERRKREEETETKTSKCTHISTYLVPGQNLPRDLIARDVEDAYIQGSACASEDLQEAYLQYEASGGRAA